jgi:hypothetical protein
MPGLVSSLELNTENGLKTVSMDIRGLELELGEWVLGCPSGHGRLTLSVAVRAMRS